MPELTGIARSSAAPPREIKPQRVAEPAREQRPDRESVLARPPDTETAAPSPSEPGKPATASAKPVSSPFQARLNYDIQEDDVYIEILSPRTGDVIQRLPPEDAVEQLRERTDGHTGAVLDRVA